MVIQISTNAQERLTVKSVQQANIVHYHANTFVNKLTNRQRMKLLLTQISWKSLSIPSTTSKQHSPSETLGFSLNKNMNHIPPPQKDDPYPLPMQSLHNQIPQNTCTRVVFLLLTGRIRQSCLQCRQNVYWNMATQSFKYTSTHYDTHTYLCMHMCAHTHTHAHACTHTHTCAQVHT